MAKKQTNCPNLELYNQFRVAPQNALRPITAGKLKGKSDINPQWRIEILTQVFGPVGLGWYTEIKETWVERDGNESVAWVRLNMFIKDPSTGEWSKPIEGLGGSKQFGKGQGDGINDEAFKMAETDAISVACKKLGVAADVYWNTSLTKWMASDEVPQWGTPAPSPSPALVQQQQAAPDHVQKPSKFTKPTVEQVIADLNSAKSTDELQQKWNYYAAGFGTNAEVVKCIQKHPFNPTRPKK